MMSPVELQQLWKEVSSMSSMHSGVDEHLLKAANGVHGSAPFPGSGANPASSSSASSSLPTASSSYSSAASSSAAGHGSNSGYHNNNNNNNSSNNNNNAVTSNGGSYDLSRRRNSSSPIHFPPHPHHHHQQQQHHHQQHQRHLGQVHSRSINGSASPGPSTPYMNGDAEGHGLSGRDDQANKASVTNLHPTPNKVKNKEGPGDRNVSGSLRWSNRNIRESLPPMFSNRDPLQPFVIFRDDVTPLFSANPSLRWPKMLEMCCESLHLEGRGSSRRPYACKEHEGAELIYVSTGHIVALCEDPVVPSRRLCFLCLHGPGWCLCRTRLAQIPAYIGLDVC
ncbi:hypothetical protein EGW08_011600 [Elysia chlorotica]|uniref:Uncharacterized protein n=1 Tax=Elysia chlorotica TaxID=188477 RepID=A0A3S1BC92_ELYCH|nr:hypothetical protein EGW08_011600 [Elysia chlorotica]